MRWKTDAKWQIQRGLRWQMEKKRKKQQNAFVEHGQQSNTLTSSNSGRLIGAKTRQSDDSRDIGKRA
jgi:hypothetical protein